ncbi:L-lysine 2,3-aminomutase [Anopheles sinensis]|uniref:L-lysine 2,3-aminomutase n=1 Tax=Anopheles sinensis TaxID=74873 RepID=A0A084VBE9_ANOSI|nr:L-lysine 2,3-aminomutase [Anopheles sinensis]
MALKCTSVDSDPFLCVCRLLKGHPPGRPSERAIVRSERRQTLRGVGLEDDDDRCLRVAAANARRKTPTLNTVAQIVMNPSLQSVTV